MRITVILALAFLGASCGDDPLATGDLEGFLSMCSSDNTGCTGPIWNVDNSITIVATGPENGDTEYKANLGTGSFRIDDLETGRWTLSVISDISVCSWTILNEDDWVSIKENEVTFIMIRAHFHCGG